VFCQAEIMGRRRKFFIYNKLRTNACGDREDPLYKPSSVTSENPYASLMPMTIFLGSRLPEISFGLPGEDFPNCLGHRNGPFLPSSSSPYLAFLHVEIAAFHPLGRTQTAFLPKRLVSVALIRPPRFATKMGITHYATL
jgi:hypothetical protein